MNNKNTKIIFFIFLFKKNKIKYYLIKFFYKYLSSSDE